MLSNYPQPNQSQSATRTVGRRSQSIIVAIAISLALLAGLGSRLAYLQLFIGERNRQLAEDNRIRLLPTPPGRGTIFDRNGKILASSRLSHSVFIWPIDQKESEWPATLRRLAKILHLPATDLQMRLEQEGYNSPSRVRMARGISPAEITALAEYSSQLPGVEVDIEAVRDYPHGDLAAHALGYTGEMNDEELQAHKDKGEGYRLGDVIGKMGVEAAFEQTLRGEWGGRQVEVDGAGQIVRILGKKPARAGSDVHLTLDLELQKAAEAALGNHNGALVAMDPQNGAILAMVSRPAFDPNLFSTRITDEQWQRLQGTDHPFVNRALQAFPPASTFKIVTTTAGIESGTFSPNVVLPTYPYLVIGGIKFADWNHAGFGPLGFAGAMAWSSDTFFYQIGKRLKGPPLIDWTRRYGFGQKTGIELSAEEVAGLVPDDRWKQERMGIPWSIGDTINMTIGQGFLQTTPVQVAVMFAVPANGGYLVRPHILKDNKASRNWRKSLNLSPETLKVLQQGLRRVVTNGTGPALNVTTIPAAAGKSGTSEVSQGETHTWFGGYAPLDKPEIVVVVFGEHSGGGGGSFAGPKVLRVLEAYFQLKRSRATVTAKQPLPDPG